MVYEPIEQSMAWMETDYETIRINSMDEDTIAAEAFGCARNYGFANLAAWLQKVVCLLFLSFFLFLFRFFVFSFFLLSYQTHMHVAWNLTLVL